LKENFFADLFLVKTAISAPMRQVLPAAAPRLPL
jgi:hypothetical protein